MKEKLISVLALFTSTGTLLCCVLPAVVATVAGGAAVGSMLSLFPWLIPLSNHKEWIFGTAGILIALNGFMVFKPIKKTACNLEAGEIGCEITGNFNKYMFYGAVFVILLGAFFAYALVPVLEFIGA